MAGLAAFGAFAFARFAPFGVFAFAGFAPGDAFRRAFGALDGAFGASARAGGRRGGREQAWRQGGDGEEGCEGLVGAAERCAHIASWLEGMRRSAESSAVLIGTSGSRLDAPSRSHGSTAERAAAGLDRRRRGARPIIYCCLNVRHRREHG
ncbi:MAG TPA: hypothetical protein VK707_10610 [Solirubrobacteraceae bacterium]|nr:hypothetical protein [Solirubrobacteraceae bacterium]